MPDPRAFSDVYAWIRAAAEARSGSLLAVSLGAGLSKNALYEMLKHKSIPDGPTLDKIAVYFGAEPAELRNTFGLNERSWEAQYHRERSGEWRTCMAPGCPRRSEPVWVITAALPSWRACSTACANARRRRFVAWNPLQVLCLEYMAVHGLSLVAFAVLVGLPDIQLRRWFRTKNSSISESSLAKIARTIGITVDQRLRDSVPVHADDRLNRGRSERASQRFSSLTVEQRQAFARQGGEGRHGWKEPREGTAKRVAAMRTTGGFDRFLAKSAEAAKSHAGRASRALHGRLRDKPRPSPVEARAWAEKASPRLGLCIGEVIAWWNPLLREQGLSQLGGHPADAKRCGAMRAFLAANPRVYGMWKAAPESKSWCQEHARGCPTMRLELSRVRAANRTETSPKPIATAERFSPYFGSEDAAMLGGLAY
jgi:transcriptional regulator with XRE-family HTH domain